MFISLLFLLSESSLKARIVVLINTLPLTQCLAYSRNSIYICGINDWYENGDFICSLQKYLLSTYYMPDPGDITAKNTKFLPHEAYLLER